MRLHKLLPLLQSTAQGIQGLTNPLSPPCIPPKFVLHGLSSKSKFLAVSPFVIDGVENLFIEDFEDGVLSIPGVTAISNTLGTSLSIGGGGPNTDSVDGDDGIIDGFGRGGQAMGESANRPTDDLGYSFHFNAALLGGLPTHAGIVWTVGSFSAPTQVEFFGPGGEFRWESSDLSISVITHSPEKPERTDSSGPLTTQALRALPFDLREAPTICQ